MIKDTEKENNTKWHAGLVIVKIREEEVDMKIVGSLFYDDQKIADLQFTESQYERSWKAFLDGRLIGFFNKSSGMGKKKPWSRLSCKAFSFNGLLIPISAFSTWNREYQKTEYILELDEWRLENNKTSANPIEYILESPRRNPNNPQEEKISTEEAPF